MVEQVRDLRLVDPQLATSYPSAILARESALVLNLEFIKVRRGQPLRREATSRPSGCCSVARLGVFSIAE